MANLDLLKPAKKVQIIAYSREGNLEILEIDVTSQIMHEKSATVTSSPVEDGSIFTNHVNLENPKITIEGRISDSPTTFLSVAYSTAIIAGFQQIVSNDPALAALSGSISGLLLQPKDKVQKAYTFLKDTFENRIPFSIVAGITNYENVLFTNISIIETSKTKNTLSFTATMEQIKIAHTSQVSVQAKNAVESIKHTATPTVDLGQKSTEQPRSVKKASSILMNLTESVKGILK